VANLAGTKLPPNAGDHVMRGHAGWFIHNNKS